MKNFLSLLAFAALIAASCASADDTQVLTAEASDVLAASADWDPLGGVAGVDAALVALEGTVVSTGGARVELRSDGFIDYNSEKDGFPSATIERIDVVTSFPLATKDVVDQVDMAVEQGELTLVHTNGYLEVGNRYLFFLGWWDNDNFSMLYGHDLEKDLPIGGFSATSADVVAALDDIATERADGITRADLILQLAGELQGTAPRDGQPSIAAALYGDPAEAPAPLIPDGMFPVEPEDLSESDAKRLVYIELVVLLEPGTEGRFGLRSTEDPEKRILGWFLPHERGYVELFGYVDPRLPYEVVLGVGDARDVRPFDADAARNLVLPKVESAAEGISGIIDTRPGSESAKMFSDLNGLSASLSEIESILDSSVPGPEPTE